MRDPCILYLVSNILLVFIRVHLCQFVAKFYNCPYFFLSLILTNSAIVFKIKVMRKSKSAARNRILYRVPPWGASGISTAMFAERALKPLKMLQSITGVLPVAMRTIIVSPTARPNPIITAEKIPAAAVGRTTRIAVCHLVAPRAKEPEIRCFGTFDKESSEIVKIMGITANPIAKPTTSEFLWSY